MAKLKAYRMKFSVSGRQYDYVQFHEDLKSAVKHLKKVISEEWPDQDYDIQLVGHAPYYEGGLS